MGKEAKYVVRLSDEERRQLQAIVDKGSGAKETRQRAWVFWKPTSRSTVQRQPMRGQRNSPR